MNERETDAEVLAVRSAWFEMYTDELDRSATRKYVPDSYSGLFQCPSCGYPTLAERGGYDICYLCNWEDDGQDDHNADVVMGGPNYGYSLTAARENFKRYGNMYTPGKDQRLPSGDTELETAVKRRIVEAFEAMRTAPAEDILRMWDFINSTRKELDDELDRKVQEYDRQVDGQL